jgi:uncharacterized membrane protein YkoI
MLQRLTKIGAALAALAAIAVGSAAISGAASTSDSSRGGQGNVAPGVGAARQHKPETPLTGETAAKVRKAALDKVSGGTIIRVETDTDHGSPYEAHVRKSDGSEVEVLVNKQFEVTAVNAFGPHR